MRYQLVLVPTSGNRRGKTGEPIPGKAAQARLVVANDYLKKVVNARLAICGGYRENGHHNEAIVAFRWLKSQNLVAWRQVAICEGSFVCTAADMAGLALTIKKLEQEKKIFFEKIVVVTHPWHGKLIKITLKDALRHSPREIVTLDSGEPEPFNRFGYRLRWLITILDPGWNGWISKPFRLMTEKRKKGF